MKTKQSTVKMALWTLSTVWFLTACGVVGSDSSDTTATTASFRITLTNITHNQPMSPLAVALHSDTYAAWELGAAASAPLEMMAESGSPTALIQAADADPDVLATTTGAGVVFPGATESVNLTATTTGKIRLTLATMLVNTNDAFGGLNGQSLDQLAVGQSATFMVPAYDAGTEANSETAATVPGPAAGGEGFNIQRDDQNFVTIHPGVISAQDGVAGSALSNAHRWDNPVVKLVVTRTS